MVREFDSINGSDLEFTERLEPAARLMNELATILRTCQQARLAQTAMRRRPHPAASPPFPMFNKKCYV